MVEDPASPHAERNSIPRLTARAITAEDAELFLPWLRERLGAIDAREIESTRAETARLNAIVVVLPNLVDRRRWPGDSLP
jgi:hypothetical protein